MNKSIRLLVGLCLSVIPLAMRGQGLDPSLLTKPATDSWPTYAGEYSQRRYSSLKQINQASLKGLTLAWISKLPIGAGGGGGFPGVGSESAPTIVGGEATGSVTIAGPPPRVGGAMLQVNGILYMSAPDNAWAVDARDGVVLWHYFWKTKGGTHIGNRGMAMVGNWLFFETPDDYLVSLDAKTGKERWHKEIADFNQEYFSTAAPIAIENHLIVGTGDDLDAPGFLQSFDPETGALQWKFYTVPMKPGDPGLDTWKNLDAASHGGAQTWIPGSYDPETHLYIFSTGNPVPAYTSETRGPGDNLYTCSLIALNIDTGKMSWYFQTSPHDTHDWDSTQAPVLVDGVFAGKPRKMVMQAARNGYFFVIDRINGEHLLTSKYSGAANWAAGIDKGGKVVRDPAKDSTFAGSLVSPDNGGATNWPPPSFDPDTGLFYVLLRESYAMYYLTESNPRLVTGLGGKEEDAVGSLGPSLVAIDYKTGNIAWKYRFPGATSSPLGITGLLTTAGKLLFSSDMAGNLVAYDPSTGTPLWHSHVGSISNAPETYLLDGRQYILVAVGDSLLAFTLGQ
jgi:alcohol dehydrogenase (cytochrome c)